MIRNELTTEAVVSLLFFGTGAGFLGIILQVLSEPYYDGYRYDLEDVFLFLTGLCFFLGGIAAGFALAFKKRRLAKLAQVIYFLGFLITAGLLLFSLDDPLDDVFLLLTVFFMFIGPAALVLLLLGSRKIFPWLIKTTLEE